MSQVTISKYSRGPEIGAICQFKKNVKPIVLLKSNADLIYSSIYKCNVIVKIHALVVLHLQFINKGKDSPSPPPFFSL